MKWLTGLGGARLERCRGWTPIRDLDDKAVVAAMRIFEDARQFQGLLGRAVQQLLLNWENTSGSRACWKTWMGALLGRVNPVWPRFRVHLSHNLSWTGAPRLRVETKFSLARQFQQDLWIHKWQARQGALLASRPRVTQQDYIFFHIIAALGSASLREKRCSNLKISNCSALVG